MTFNEFLARHRQFVVLIALVMASAGVGLLLTPLSASSAWVGLSLVAVGGAVMSLAVWPKDRTLKTIRSSLGSRLIRVLTLRGKLSALMPAIGVGIILADIAYNLLLSATPSVQTEDTIALLGASSLVAYGFVPSRFSRERDFVLVFFIILNGLLVVPLLIARAFYSDFERSVDLYSWAAVAPEVSAVLSVLGVSNSVHSVTGSTAPGLTFTPLHFPVQVTVVITTACSGIYSFGIFASAFVAFVLTEYAQLTRRIWILLGLGLFAAYVANVLRMVVIVLIGYHTDTVQSDLQNMLIAHSYAGWLIFLGWISVFWGVLLKFVPQTPAFEETATSSTKESSRRNRCSICSVAMTPAIPGTRCACGAVYHTRCLLERSGCPTCGRTKDADLSELGRTAG